jgi:hypothetical protein
MFYQQLIDSADQTGEVTPGIFRIFRRIPEPIIRIVLFSGTIHIVFKQHGRNFDGLDRDLCLVSMRDIKFPERHPDGIQQNFDGASGQLSGAFPLFLLSPVLEFQNIIPDNDKVALS